VSNLEVSPKGTFAATDSDVLGRATFSVHGTVTATGTAFRADIFWAGLTFWAGSTGSISKNSSITGAVVAITANPECSKTETWANVTVTGTTFAGNGFAVFNCTPHISNFGSRPTATGDPGVN